MVVIKNVRLLEGGADCVHIDGARIAYVGTEAGAPPVGDGARVIDGGGGLLMPGLANAHTHVSMTLLRGVGSDLALMDWLGRIFPLEDKLTGEDVYWGAMLGIAEMLRFGVTCFADMYYFMGDVARAVMETGIRANLSRGITGTDASDTYRIDENAALFRDYHGADGGRVRVTFGPHAEYTTNPDVLRAVLSAADKLGAGCHLHASETASETADCIKRHGLTPIAYFDKLGFFDRPALAAHCVHATPADIDILARKCVTVAHCPISNLKLASGVMPLPAMLDGGVRVALGADGASSNNTYNMFEAVRIAAMLHKGVTGDPTLIDARRVTALATSGAALLGFDNIGAVERGMAADLIILRTDVPHAVPMPSAYAHIAYAAQGSDVRMTMVDGKVLYMDGQYTTLDIERVMAKARAAAERLTA